MKDIAKLIIAILLIVLAWKIVKGLFGILITLAAVGLLHLGRDEAARERAEAPQMSVIAIIVAVVLAFIVFRFVAGMVKFGVIALIAVAVIYFLAKGGGLG